ncbi:MAG: hypothetical protein M3410_16535 [Acidobacteriota bacterium]|nr:hypothetical protein [Acidobacteriota bacterium]
MLARTKEAAKAVLTGAAVGAASGAVQGAAESGSKVAGIDRETEKRIESSKGEGSAE